MNDNFQNSTVNNEQTSVQNLQFMTEQQSQSAVSNSQYVTGQAMNNEGKSNKTCGTKLKIVIGIVVILLFVIGLTCYYFISMNNSTNIYRNLVKEGINEIYDVVYQDYDKMNTTLNMDFDLDLEQELLDQKFIDLINKTTISFNYQIDMNSKQLVLKLDSDYENDSLIDLQLFVDSKNKETYLYAKDYYDKYIGLEVDDYTFFAEWFEERKLTIGQPINDKKAKKIIINEFAKIIKSKDCSKENGNYVIKITEKEMLKRIKTVMNNLKNNKKFLNCYEEPSKAKDNITSIINDINIKSASTKIIKISINKKMFSSKIDKLTVSSMNYEVIFENKGEEITYKFSSENELVLSGYIKMKEEKNTTKSETLVEIPKVGKLKVNLDIVNKNNKDIDKADISNVKLSDDITEAEQTEIMAKIEKSKLYEIITLISEGL